MEPFSLGRVLALGFQMWGRSLVRLWPLLLLLWSPLLAVAASLALHGPVYTWMEATWVLGALLEIPVWAVVTASTVRELRGQPQSLRASMSEGFHRTPALLVTMVLVYLVTLAIGFVCMLPVTGSNSALGYITVAAVMIIVWSTIAVLLHARWFVAVPALVFERAGIVGALSRSSQLTAGHRSDLGAMIVLMFVIIGAGLAVPTFLADSWLGTAEAHQLALVDLLWLPLTVLRATLASAAYHVITTGAEDHSPAKLDEVFG